MKIRSIKPRDNLCTLRMYTAGLRYRILLSRCLDDVVDRTRCHSISRGHCRVYLGVSAFEGRGREKSVRHLMRQGDKGLGRFKRGTPQRVLPAVDPSEGFVVGITIGSWRDAVTKRHAIATPTLSCLVLCMFARALAVCVPSLNTPSPSPSPRRRACRDACPIVPFFTVSITFTAPPYPRCSPCPPACCRHSRDPSLLQGLDTALAPPQLLWPLMAKRLRSRMAASTKTKHGLTSCDLLAALCDHQPQLRLPLPLTPTPPAAQRHCLALLFFVTSRPTVNVALPLLKKDVNIPMPHSAPRGPPRST